MSIINLAMPTAIHDGARKMLAPMLRRQHVRLVRGMTIAEVGAIAEDMTGFHIHDRVPAREIVAREAPGLEENLTSRRHEIAPHKAPLGL